jgi:hypothetical protein
MAALRDNSGWNAALYFIHLLTALAPELSCGKSDTAKRESSSPGTQGIIFPPMFGNCVCDCKQMFIHDTWTHQIDSSFEAHQHIRRWSEVFPITNMIPTPEISKTSIELSHIVLTLIGRRRHGIYNVHKIQVHCRSRKLKSGISLSPKIKFGINALSCSHTPSFTLSNPFLEFGYIHDDQST